MAAEYVVRVAVLCPQETEERWTHAISALQQYVTRTPIQILNLLLLLQKVVHDRTRSRRIFSPEHCFSVSPAGPGQW